jgi:hypothetical protein
MCRHVIRSFIGMNVFPRAIRDQSVKNGFKVNSYCWIRIFVDANPRRGMLYENMQQALFGQFRKIIENMSRD